MWKYVGKPERHVGNQRMRLVLETFAGVLEIAKFDYSSQDSETLWRLPDLIFLTKIRKHVGNCRIRSF